MPRKRRNIFRKANGHWVVHKRIYGRQVWKTFPTLAEAEIYLSQITIEARRGSFTAPARIRFCEYADQWIRYAHGHLHPRTIDGYVCLLRNHLLPHFGERWLSQISRQDIDMFMADWLAGGPFFEARQRAVQDAEYRAAREERRRPRSLRLGRAPGTVGNGVTPLQAMLSTAVEWKLIASSPAAGVRRPRVPKQPMRILDPDEVRALLGAVEQAWRALVMCAVTTGVRQGELLALRWNDLELDEGKLWVRSSLGRDGIIREPKTSASVRCIAVPKTTVLAMREHWLAAQDKAPASLIFRSKTGSPLNGSNIVSRIFRPALTKANLALVRWHDLRHTYASLLIAAGAHPKLISEQMGHSSVRTTMDRYGHLLSTSYLDASARLERTLFTVNGASALA